MPNYQNSKIYKLVGNNKIYIGSTTQELCKRKFVHVSKYKQNSYCYTSYEIVSDPNHYIELIEFFPCNSKEELFMRERYWIENTMCVNKCMPYRTAEEKKERAKKYIEANKDIIKEKSKKYYLNNKDKKYQIEKKYYEANKDKINERRRKRYQEKKHNQIILLKINFIYIL